MYLPPSFEAVMAAAASTVSPLTKDSRLTLGDGRTMPVIGFGTYQIKEEECEAPVHTALRLGYRHVDTAQVYGNEEACGRALAASGVSREELYVTTKLWPGNPDWNQPPKSFEQTVECCEASVRKLGLERCDLYLIHTPLGGGKEGRLAQYRGLVECQKRGLCTSIGVSNYGVAHLEEIAAEGLPLPAANQLELHPMSQKAALLAYMAERGILPIAYSSLAPLSNWRVGQQSAKSDAQRADVANSGVGAIAAKYRVVGRSEAQVLLRYALQKGWAILPKSVSEVRAAANLDVFSFALSDADMAALDAMERGATFAFGAPGQPLDPTQCA